MNKLHNTKEEKYYILDGKHRVRIWELERSSFSVNDICKQVMIDNPPQHIDYDKYFQKNIVDMYDNCKDCIEPIHMYTWSNTEGYIKKSKLNYC